MTPESLPPLAAIRVFEAAARHGSFTRAGEELGMTQAAVSYQIKVLEDRVGAALFIRAERRVRLSPAGARLAPAVREGLGLIRQAFAAVRTEGNAELAITATATFAVNWLVPRLGAFQMANPSIAVRLGTEARLVDLAEGSFDVGIRSGQGGWPGLVSHLLMRSTLSPMLSPALAARHGAIRTPRDILPLPRVAPKDPMWKVWFRAAGLVETEPVEPVNILLESQQMEATAAMAGHGVAILTSAFFQKEIAAGLLVQPFDLVTPDGHGYWLVYPEGLRHASKIKRFRDWILSEIAAPAA